MEYLSAAEWYFWHGVDVGYHALEACLTVKDIDSLTPSFKMDNQVTNDCLDAFNWGFCLGLTLANQDYVDLTTNPETVIIENIEQYVSETDEKIINSIKEENDFEPSNIIGNC